MPRLSIGTLRGRILPTGGLKEKLLAVHRAGIKKVLIPAENEPDIKMIPRTSLKAIEIETVEHMDEVLVHALVLPPGRSSVMLVERPQGLGPLPMLASTAVGGEEGEVVPS